MENRYYTLTVDQNFEGGHRYTVQILENEPYIKPWLGDRFSEPGRPGYTFAGWHHDPACKEPVGEEEQMCSDTVIYAAWKKMDAETAAWMEEVMEEAKAARYICDRPAAYTRESFYRYFNMCTGILFMTLGSKVFPRVPGTITALKEARENLMLAEGICDPEESIWYIWGEDMPREENADSYNYYGTWDNAGFRPFLVPFMLKDQNRVKGNIILVSGGGAQYRANRWEAYPVIEEFNSLGYNCFVLQRRVAPSPIVDGGLDLQRAVRYLKYHAKEYGIARMENLTAAGYSGGGYTVQVAVSKFYGSVKPTAVYPDYKCDNIDGLNSDFSSMILIYSASPLETENPRIPDAFVIVGIHDEYQHHKVCIRALEYYTENNIRYEAHFFSDVGHGFGNGFGINAETFRDEEVENVKVWPKLADTFLSIQYGLVDNIKPF